MTDVIARVTKALLSAALISVAGCTSTKPPDPSTVAGGPSAAEKAPPATTVTAPPRASKPFNLQLIQGVAGEEFYITMQCGAQAEAAKLGVTLRTQGAQKFDPTLQKPVLDSVAQSNPDAILIAPTDTTAMQQPLLQAAQKSRVILVDTTVDDPSFATTRIASNNEAAGAAAFDALRGLNPEGGKILIMSTDPGISTVDARISGFEAAASTHADVTYLGVQYSHNDPATAAKLMTAALQKDPDISGVFAANILAAEGTATGVRQAGKLGQVKIVGFDAGPSQVQALREGIVDALVAQEPYQIGQYGVDLAVAALEGAKVPARVQTGYTILNRDNIDTTEADSVYKSSC
jgi:ribose transport system substrate-binding protein